MILKQWHSFCLCAEDNTLFPQDARAVRRCVCAAGVSRAARSAVLARIILYP